MELKTLTEETFKLFGVSEPNQLGQALIKATDTEYRMFSELVENDLSIDWMQMIYQYYLADRSGKKQDYTPKTLASFMARLTGKEDCVIDLCAGSGALTIQRWTVYPDTRFVCYEMDERVIPFLLFNLALRNIEADVHRSDVLSGDIFESWKVRKGECYGCISPF